MPAGIQVESVIRLPKVLKPYQDKLRASSLWTRVAQGLFWSLVGAVASRIISVGGTLVVARWLGITAFGEFTVIQSTLGLFGTFAGLGLGITATKYVAELRRVAPDRCGRIIGLVLTIAAAGGLCASALVVAVAPWLAVYTLAEPQLTPFLRSGSAVVLFGSLQGTYLGALGGFEAFKCVARVNWLTAALGTPILVGAAVVGGLEGAVWGSVAQAAVGCALAHAALWREAARAGAIPRWTGGAIDWHLLWKFSLPAFLSTMLVGPANWFSNALLVHQPHGYQEAALLNVAIQWRNVVSFLPMMLSTVLLPILTDLHQAARQAEFRQALRRTLLITLTVCLALVAVLLPAAPLILRSYGEGFQTGVPVFMLTLVGTLLIAASNLYSRAMQAIGRAWLEFGFNLLWAVVLFGGCLLLVPAYRATGVALANIAAVVPLAIWQWWLIRRLLSRPTVPESTVPRIYEYVD